MNAPHVEIHASGMNGALARVPRVHCQHWPLSEAPEVAARWRPTWQAVKTIGLVFPDGVDLAECANTAPAREAETSVARPADLCGGTQRIDGAALPPAAPHIPCGRTRLQPPSDAISLEDRLFFVLQPPLESWLRGGELLLPYEPFAYQYQGIAWLFCQKAALLADEMGLGKTMQTITAVRLLLRAGQVRRVLLVCPKPLIPNWQREFKTWARELPLLTIEGDAPRRQLLWSMQGALVLLANYEILVRDAEVVEGQSRGFDLVILDEAQRIKNRDSRTAQCARAVSRKRSWALTGTPIENRPEELTSLYEYLEVVPARATPDLASLTRLSRQYVLRRTKAQVLRDLPPRLDRDEVLELGPAQRLAYDTAEKEGVVQLDAMGDAVTIQHVFELVLRLKQITNFDPLTGESAKLERLEAELEEIASSGGKAILFSQWVGCIEWLKQQLAGMRPLVYHGKVPPAQREGVLARFRDDPRSPLLMMSYATGAVGLNLQFAGYVYLFDRWWNPAVEDQAINRAHRIGQKSQVIVTRFISKDTIEERINRVLEEKRALFAKVLGDGQATQASAGLSAAEIMGLFNLKARPPRAEATLAAARR